jgi:hypothetical protein
VLCYVDLNVKKAFAATKEADAKRTQLTSAVLPLLTEAESKQSGLPIFAEESAVTWSYGPGIVSAIPPLSLQQFAHWASGERASFG